jgi:hypothetical protein
MAASRPALRPLISSRGASRPESIIDSAQAADLALTPAELTTLDQS